MRLTTYTDYALRVLIYVGLKNDELVRIDEVAASFQISRNHLSKVVHNLGAKGYLQTVQGRNGGFHLARDSADINVGQVVRDFEPDFNLVECFDSSQSKCRIQPSCVLAGELDAALSAFLDRLDGVTLRDLIHPRPKLQANLGLPRTRVSAIGITSGPIRG
jgi:Rrf2 family transcriptional regulator, nitric oxide-sensitive transcriptional repressor